MAAQIHSFISQRRTSRLPSST